MEFNVTSPVHVVGLGAFDSGLLSQLKGWDGSSGVTVGIFNRTTQSLVGSSVLFTGSNGTQVNGDAFLPASVTLPGGRYSVVASNICAYNDGGDPESHPARRTVPAGQSLSSAAEDHIGGSTFTYPTNGDGGPTNRYDAGTFIVTPEPASFLLAGLGAVGLCVVARRRKA